VAQAVVALVVEVRLLRQEWAVVVAVVVQDKEFNSLLQI
jgi:hypothetical protein